MLRMLVACVMLFAVVAAVETTTVSPTSTAAPLAINAPVVRHQRIGLIPVHESIIPDLDEDNATDLQLAVYRGDVDVVAAMLNANHNFISTTSLRLIRIAAGQCDPNMIDFLAKAGAPVETADQHLIVEVITHCDRNLGNLVESLINAGLPVDRTRSMGITHSLTPIYCSQVEAPYNLNLLQVLIDAGADVNTRNPLDKTMLHLAVDSGNLGRAQLLLENGARIDAIAGDDDFTPLLSAVDNCPGRRLLEMCQLLVSYQADPRAVDNSGRSVLFLAKKYMSAKYKDAVVAYIESLL